MNRVTVWYLRAYAALLMLALPATVMPTRWLAWSYAWLGLGEWPRLPLLEYLARSASGLYALIGAMVLLASFDVPRYRPLLRLLGWVSLPGAMYLCWLDAAVGLPGWWAWLEGGMVALTGAAMLWLTRRGGGV